MRQFGLSRASRVVVLLCSMEHVHDLPFTAGVTSGWAALVLGLLQAWFLYHTSTWPWGHPGALAPSLLDKLRRDDAQ